MRLFVLLPLAPCVLVLVSISPGCTPDQPECAAPADCGAVEDAPCERCATPATSVCVQGACAAVGAADVDVSATFQVARALDGVNGLVWAIAVADRACGDVVGEPGAGLPADLNALASGQKTLSGGDLHPDLQLAPVPAGAVLVIGLATSGAAGEGDVLGAGCVEADAAPPALAVDLINLD